MLTTLRLGVCTGPNFRILLGQARGRLARSSRSPELYSDMLCLPHLSPTSIHSSPNEAQSIYNPSYRIINILILMHKCQQSLNKFLTTLKKYLKLFRLLTNHTNLSDGKFVGFYLEQFTGGTGTKIPGKIQSVRFVA
jgi:hypothetical protein